MPHPTKKKQRIEDHYVASADDGYLASFGDISVDVLANISGYLQLKDIMCKRRVCTKWKEAVKKTLVPPSYFSVSSVEKFYTMRVMSTEMPNLQLIRIIDFAYDEFSWIRHKFDDGEDPDGRRAAETADYTTHDIAILSNFSKLRILSICRAELNGRYPVLFSFPLLLILRITECKHLKFDLEMLAGFPVLKELDCYYNDGMTGKIISLRELKDTLVKVTIVNCPNVEGKLMDLADFPHVKVLNLYNTAVTGDIRDIGENDFSSLEELDLPQTVYGGTGYELQRISDAPDLMRAIYIFNKERPTLFSIKDWFGQLSEDSPDWYDFPEEAEETPPFFIRFVEAGSRVGYQWETNEMSNPCEVNWLDPEPDRETSEYARYIEELQEINRQLHMYREFNQPPTEEEYHRLYEEWR